MKGRHFTELKDRRLTGRGNRILDDLFRRGCHSIRQFTKTDADAKGCYRFLQNERITEEQIIANLAANCRSAAKGKYVVCIQDTTQINLSAHSKRLQHDQGNIGPTNNKGTSGIGFFLHPGLVLDAVEAIPYGYAAIKIWNRASESTEEPLSKGSLSSQDKESYKWIEVSKDSKKTLSEVVEGMVIIQDREGDLYEQFATIPDRKTALLIRARTNRVLEDGSRLFDAVSDFPPAGSYRIEVVSKGTREARSATIEIRYREVVLRRPRDVSKDCPPFLSLYLIEAKEKGYDGSDAICWRLLTTLDVPDIETARTCIDWYSWRWTIEEVFKILKKEGFNIEASELERGASVRKMSLMILEVIIKLFLMRLAYTEPEVEISADSCFSKEEQDFMEDQIPYLEGKTQKQKNPYSSKDLKRYVWAVARLGGWKGYESKRHPGITTLWTGLQYFYAAMQGWKIHRNVSTR